MLVFIPAVGEFVIPALLGGPDALMIGRVLWEELFNNRDWPVASAVAIAISSCWRSRSCSTSDPRVSRSGATREHRPIPVRHGDDDRGFLFLYLPIVLMIVFSFNEFRLVTVWGGFSTKWYGELFRTSRSSVPLALVQDRGDDRDRRDDPRHDRGAALARFGHFRGRPS